MHVPVQVAQQYLSCLEGNEGEAQHCKELAKKYLECRMERWELSQEGA